MLRTIFVLTLLAAGVASCIGGPFNGLLLYLWIAYFRPENWVWGGTIASLHLSLFTGIAVVVMTLLAIGRVRIRFTWDIWLLVAYFVQSVISAWFAIDQRAAWVSWDDFARILLIGWLITANVTTEKRLRLAFLVIALSLGFEAAKQGWAQFILHPGARNMNTDPMLGDNNGVAMGMFMLAPIFGALAKTASTLWEKTLHRFFLVGVVLRGISTYSRGGFLAAGAVALVYILHSRRRARTLLGTCLIAALVLGAMPDQFWNRMQTIDASADNRDTSEQGRLYFWGVGLRMGEAHPLTGVGFNNFQSAYDAYDTTGGLYGEDRAVHSAWFGTLAEQGWPGLFLFLLIIITALANCRKARRLVLREEPEGVIAELAIALQAGLIAYVVGATFLAAQYNEMLWHLVCLTIALKWVAADAPSGALEVPERQDPVPAFNHWGLPIQPVGASVRGSR